MRADLTTIGRRAALLSLTSLFAPLPSPALDPSPAAVVVAKRAFRAFDDRELPLADDLFTQTIDEWRRLDRDVAELTSLLVARAGVRTDRTDFIGAKADLDEAISLMAPTGEPPAGAASGRARYREYPDAFVQRGLAKEGLRDWVGALADYDRAVGLWGEGCATACARPPVLTAVAGSYRWQVAAHQAA